MLANLEHNFRTLVTAVSNGGAQMSCSELCLSVTTVVIAMVNEVNFRVVCRVLMCRVLH